MKRITKFLITLVIIHFSCKSGNQNATSANEITATPAAAINITKEKLFENVKFASKYDTSCGMPLSAGVEDTLHVNDKVYGFCSKECKEDFINKLKGKKNSR